MEDQPEIVSASSGTGKLLLEVWEYRLGDGQPLSSLEYAGPRGDAARALLPPSARLLTTLWASSHYEAMTLYYRVMGWGTYTTDQTVDHEPYPEAWVAEQKNAGVDSAGQ
jgi:hypothetical protein